MFNRADRIKRRRKNIQKLIDKSIESYPDIQKKKLDNKRIIIEKLLSNPAPIYGDCPYSKAQPKTSELYELVKDPDDDYPEPFGLPKGTIRGAITILVTFTFCVMTIVKAIPIDYFVYVSMAVILSYFVTRMNLSHLFK